MIPSNLLRAKVSRGRVYPVYLPLDFSNISLARRITEVFSGNIGRRKGDIEKTVKTFEDEGFDYRVVRGLSLLLERRCIFETESPVNPRKARMRVFEEASKARAVSEEDRQGILEGVGRELDIRVEELERALYSDADEELVLKKFDAIHEDALIKHYNLSLAQALLFKSLRTEFTASENWKAIFRAIKRLGLMYSVEHDGKNYRIFIDGPLSIFKMTDRYGTSMAKLLPKIVTSREWMLKAEILSRNRNRIYNFEVDRDKAHGLMEEPTDVSADTQLYDSTVEERFARAFNALNNGWVLKREPEPLLAGRYVLIPDFGLEKHDMKVYLEIVGFWTKEYLERKVSKLNSLGNVDMFVAVDKSLACSKIEEIKGKHLIYYEKVIPLASIVEHLNNMERIILERYARHLRKESIRLHGDVVSFEDIAKEQGLPVEAVGKAIGNFSFEGYRRVGGYFITIGKLNELSSKIEAIKDGRLSDVVKVIEAQGIGNLYEVLEALGYTVTWHGLDMEKSTVKRNEQQGSLYV